MEDDQFKPTESNGISDFLRSDEGEISAEGRRQQIQDTGKRAIVRAATTTMETTITNSDATLGAITYATMNLCGWMMARGQYFHSFLAFLATVLLCIVKHRLPQGPLIDFIKKPKDEIIHDVKTTLTGRRR